MTGRFRIFAGILRLLLVLGWTTRLSLAFYSLAIPGALWAWAAASEANRSDPRHLAAGVLALSCWFVGLRGLGLQLARQLSDGTLETLRTTGATPPLYLASLWSENAILCALPGLSLLVFLRLVRPELLPLGCSWLVPYLLCIALATFLATALAAWAPSFQTAGLAINLTLAVLISAFPFLYPEGRVPEALRIVVQWLPPTLLVEALAVAWNGGTSAAASSSALAIWALLAAAGSIRTFRMRASVAR